VSGERAATVYEAPAIDSRDAIGMPLVGGIVSGNQDN
jgi:hypothetical protein